MSVQSSVVRQQHRNVRLVGKDVMSSSIPNVWTWTGALVLILLVLLGVNARPKPQNFNPLKNVAMLDPEKVVCTAQTESLCQQCAKQTESAVVYPWCCANHEGVQEWCENYLYFGLP